MLSTQMLNAFDGDTDSLVLRFTAPATFRTYRVGQEAFTSTDTLAIRSDGRGFSLRRPFPHGFVGDIRIKNKEETEVPNVGRPADIRYALSNSLGFGGHNGSLLLKKWED